MNRPPNEAGSAYIITLMVLFVLTIVGLSLTMVTQTEMLVGSQERTVQRIFYAADSGIGVATARALVFNEHKKVTYRLADNRQLSTSGAFDRDDVLEIVDEVEVSPFVPILDAPCNLCQINQGNKFYEVNHAVTISATRNGTPLSTGESVPLARKVISSMVEIQPRAQTAESFFVPDPKDLEKVKF